MVDMVSRFRKKYTLAILLFLAGTAHSFYFQWSAGEYTTYAMLLLGIFGSADLVDKKAPNLRTPG